MIDALVGQVRIRKQLNCSLIPRSRQCLIEAADDRQIRAGPKSDDPRGLPSTGQHAQYMIGKLWRLIHRRPTECVPPVRCRTIPAVISTVVRNCGVLARNGELGICKIADAMGPGVVGLHRHPFRLAPLNRNHHSVVVAGSAIIQLRHGAEELPLHRILEIQFPSVVDVSGGRANGDWRGRSRKRARTQAQKHRGINLVSAPQMDDAGPHVICRNQPVCPDLSLDTQVPLLRVRRLRIEGHIFVATESHKGAVLREDSWKGIAARKSLPRIREARWVLISDVVTEGRTLRESNVVVE